MIRQWRLRITNKCNAKCSFCHGESSLLGKINAFIQPQFVELFFDKHVKRNDNVAITGGEPLLHPQICEIINIVYAKVKNNFHLNTNGILLGHKLSDLLKTELCDIHINITTFDSLLYKNIYKIEFPDKLQENIIKAQSTGLKITINSVVLQKINDDETSILNMIDICSRLCCDLTFIQEYEIPYTDKSGGLEFQNRFESILVTVGYSYLSTSIGRKKYAKSAHQIIVAAPCAPHFAWNANEYVDSFVIMENQQIKKFSNSQIIQL